MDDIIKAAVVDIESTTDLLERALKLAGLLSSMFQKHGFPLATARKMMAAAIGDPTFNWGEAERIAALPAFDVLKEMRTLHAEIENG